MLLTVAAIAANLFMGVRCSEGQDVISRENQLKALFIYNFGTYIEWPGEVFTSEKSPFVIGVVGETGVDEHLRNIAATKTIGGRPISIETYATSRAAKPCQILFISHAVAKKDQQVEIASQTGHSILIVGESDGFAADGGCVNFFVEANKIRFEINLEAARKQQLKISSKLLTLAKLVGPGSPDAVKR